MDRQHSQGEKPRVVGRWGVAGLMAIGVIAAMVVYMGVQVADRLTALRSAPQDNMRWFLAQFDVELLALQVAAVNAKDGSAAKLGELRQRFDVFYSRVVTTSSFLVLGPGKGGDESTAALQHMRTELDALTPFIDGKDDALRPRVEEIEIKVEAMRPVARQISLEGVKQYAAQTDSERAAFSVLLSQTAVVGLFLVLGLAFALGSLARQIQISRQRAARLEASAKRNAITINASLDPIIVADANGRIADFNPAACAAFGYSKNGAVGQGLVQLIAPERFRALLAEVIDGVRDTGTSWDSQERRTQITARRADNSEFSAEISLGKSNGPDGTRLIVYVRDITSRLEQEGALLRARDEALQAAKAKSQFLAVMSHEMRTPLNGVMAILDLLASTRLERKQKTYVRTAITSAEILKQHVDDVLDLNRIQAGKLELFPRTFDLQELLEEIQSLNFVTAASLGNRIVLDVQIKELHFVGDRKRLHQVLTNLVSNAIKFTRNGQVRICVRLKHLKAGMVVAQFKVRDNGIGIAPKNQNAIFEDFVTVDGSYRRDAAGAGLGLPISRSIVAAMGGEIGVTSRLGTGSEFWFTTPLKVASSACAKREALARQPSKREAQKALDILLVDDNETNRFVAAELLKSKGCHVVHAQDGQEAVRLATAKAFDLIVMDISMPGMDGWEAAQRLRASLAAKSQSCLIYALTAHALPEERAALGAAGMDGLILKPLRSRDLDLLLMKVRADMPSVARAPSGATSQHSRTTGDIDWTIVEELRDVLGNDQFAVRVNGFLAELEPWAAEISKLALANQRLELAAIAHKLAGAAAVCGARKVRQICNEIERNAQKASKLTVKKSALMLKAAVLHVRIEMAQFLAQAR